VRMLDAPVDSIDLGELGVDVAYPRRLVCAGVSSLCPAQARELLLPDGYSQVGGCSRTPDARRGDVANGSARRRSQAIADFRKDNGGAIPRAAVGSADSLAAPKSASFWPPFIPPPSALTPAAPPRPDYPAVTPEGFLRRRLHPVAFFRG
jgi:hypothetical protein